MVDGKLIPLNSISKIRGEVIAVEVTSKISSLHSLAHKQTTDFLLSSKSKVVMLGDSKTDIKVDDIVILREMNMESLSVYATHSEKRTELISGSDSDYEEVEYNLGIAIVSIYDVVMVLK